METSIALNRLSKVRTVRASADLCESRGDLLGALTLRRIAARNEAEVFAVRPDLKT